jgi:Arc/MetJ-type ribon-helix-helix transcriptional regulator
MAIITVRVDGETKRLMREIRINWSDFIRNAIRDKIEEERGRNLAKAVLINEKLKRKSRGEAKAEEIIRMFREERYVDSGG